ncbi:MAG: hypothetical protein QOH01_2970 [Verrucomicrobiota bacterium]|jgi:uncharacterized protein with HEPN domain
MPKRDADLLLEDIRSALARIGRYTSGMQREEFLVDEKTMDAVVRNLEIIGEAVRWLPDDLKLQHVGVSWGPIAGLRNRIVHDYFGLDLEIIWQILQTPLRDFRQQLDEMKG